MSKMLNRLEEKGAILFDNGTKSWALKVVLHFFYFLLHTGNSADQMRALRRSDVANLPGMAHERNIAAARFEAIRHCG